ncbi:hypothetical protein [uncultured Microbulbifer sp.]|uniref:hypothetical protein n=1 Tax=uncultured Microbulbifer sp. TaxID=348147 RepID=UPI00260F1B1F|nr:hypothetical protein [uncultured Microbulbifer sp.]
MSFHFSLVCRKLFRIVPPVCFALFLLIPINRVYAQDPPFSLIGQLGLPGITDVVVSNNIAYVCGNNGISVVDISSPDSPVLINTVGFSATTCTINNSLLAAVTSGSGFPFRLYSLSPDPQTPILLGSTTIPYAFPGRPLIINQHAYVRQLLFCFFISNNDIFSQHGDLLSIAIGNIAAPALDTVLFNDNGPRGEPGETPGCGENGGNFNVFNIAQTDATTILLTSTTATGGDTQTGIGRIRVVDISNPSSLVVLNNNELQIPGTVQTVGLAVQGNQALVSASTGGWNDGSPITLGLTGSIVLAVLDVSDADAPMLLASEILDRDSIGVGNVVSLSNNRYVFPSFGFFNDPDLLYLVDASDPANLIIDQIEVPENITHLSVSDNLIYTASAAGLLIYQVGIK